MSQPPIFVPDNKEDILAFFQQYKYAVVADALPPDDIRTLNAFVDRSKGKSLANGAPTTWASFRTGRFWFTIPSWTALSSRRSPII